MAAGEFKAKRVAAMEKAPRGGDDHRARQTEVGKKKTAFSVLNGKGSHNGVDVPLVPKADGMQY